MTHSNALPFKGTRLQNIVAKTKLGKFMMGSGGTATGAAHLLAFKLPVYKLLTETGGSVVGMLFVLAPKLPGGTTLANKLAARL